jgi:hypothetical protein
MKNNVFRIEDTRALTLYPMRADELMLNKIKCLNTLKKYGFVEISELIHYVNSIEGECIDSWDAKFVLDRVNYCLERYGDEDDYFKGLKSLSDQLSNLLLAK